MEASTSVRAVKLPPGVQLGPGRETSQSNQQNQLVPGMVFPITTPNGSTTSVFISYTDLHNPAAAQKIIDDRVNAIMAITG